MVVESKKRSLFKALSWRVVATLITMIVVWFTTKEAALSISIGLMDSIIKIGAYYGHERLWGQITFGLLKPGPHKGVHGEGI